MKFTQIKVLIVGCLAAVAGSCSRQSDGPAPTPQGDKDTHPAYLQGRADAQADIHRGQLILKTYGLPAPDREVYTSNLMKHFHVELRPVAGCVVDETLSESVKGYDEVMTAEIERRFGAGVLDRAMKESEDEYNRSFEKR